MKDWRIKRMLEVIEEEVHYTRRQIGKSALDPKVMEAMEKTPRGEFVPKSYLAAALDDGPLPIGHGQTISQPFIVALMTDLLALKAGDRALEVGTGSGYQTAILSPLCKQVYTVEFLPALARKAQSRFAKLGYHNIESMIGNGYEGWPEHAPYDAIIVTAAATHIPQPLLNQLKPGGRMVIPVGPPYMHQKLMLVTKNEKQEIESKDIIGVAFVPLQGEPENVEKKAPVSGEQDE